MQWEAMAVHPYELGPELDSVIDDLEQVEGSATRGHWSSINVGPGTTILRTRSSSSPGGGGAPVDTHDEVPFTLGDAMFCARVRNQLPRLIATLRDLQRERDRLMGEK
jgi:hypothetical protein